MKNLLADNFDYLTISNQLELKTTAGQEFLRLALQQCKLMDNKQIDYGSKNISSFGTFGVIVRMNDKIERVKNIKGLKPNVVSEIKAIQKIIKFIQQNEVELSVLEQIVQINNVFDKLRSVFGQKRRKAVNESIQDSFRDLSNYALIAVLLETGKWPNE